MDGRGFRIDNRIVNIAAFDSRDNNAVGRAGYTVCRTSCTYSSGVGCIN